jgi:hypothetical protein
MFIELTIKGTEEKVTLNTSCIAAVMEQGDHRVIIFDNGEKEEVEETMDEINERL